MMMMMMMDDGGDFFFQVALSGLSFSDDQGVDRTEEVLKTLEVTMPQLLKFSVGRSSSFK